MLATQPGTARSQATTVPARVVLAEDHALFADALAQTLRASGRFEVLECVTSGDALVTAWQHHRPDLVVTDLSMRPVGGIEATKAIRALDPEAKVCIVSAFEDQYLVKDAVAAGVVGFVSKGARGEELVAHLTAAAEGRHAFDANATQVLVNATRGVEDVLSPRQLEVLSLRAKGLTNAEIGDRLFISVATVKTHLAGIYQRFGVSGSNAAIRRAMELGLIRTDITT